MDKILKEALEKESLRQEQNIELIASENYVSKDILTLQGSILINMPKVTQEKDIMVAVNT